MKRTIVGITALLLMTACSTTWVDDERNYKRAFRIDKPSEIQVLHSYYQKNPHLLFTDEDRWFFVERYPGAEKLPEKFVSDDKDYYHAVPDANARNGCSGDVPSWFVPKKPDHYEMWVSKSWSGLRIFLDKDDHTVHSCGGYWLSRR